MMSSSSQKQLLIIMLLVSTALANKTCPWFTLISSRSWNYSRWKNKCNIRYPPFQAKSLDSLGLFLLLPKLNFLGHFQCHFQPPCARQQLSSYTMFVSKINDLELMPLSQDLEHENSLFFAKTPQPRIFIIPNFFVCHVIT